MDIKSRMAELGMKQVDMIMELRKRGIPHCTMEALSYEKSELNLKDIMDYGITLERWLSKC